jgi:hypothetical protein
MGLLDTSGSLETRVSDCDHGDGGGGGGWGGKRTGADLRAAFEASCLRGALPPVDLRAVCYTTVSHHHHRKCAKTANGADTFVRAMRRLQKRSEKLRFGDGCDGC